MKNPHFFKITIFVLLTIVPVSSCMNDSNTSSSSNGDVDDNIDDDSSNDDNVGDDEDCPVWDKKGWLYGYIIDDSNNNLQACYIKITDRCSGKHVETHSDSHGFFNFEMLHSSGFFVLEIQKDGYIPITRPVDIKNSLNSIMFITMNHLSDAKKIMMKAASPYFAQDGVSFADVPDGALVDENGNHPSGPVDFLIQVFNPYDKSIRSIPKLRRSSPTDTYELSHIFTAGFFSAESEGQALQVADGMSIHVELAIDPSSPVLSKFKADQKLNLISMFNDETGGIWVPETSGVITNSSVDPKWQVFSFDLTHFSWWGGAIDHLDTEEKILFIERKDGINSEIMMMDSDGGNIQPITNLDLCIVSFDFSPNGRYLSFITIDDIECRWDPSPSVQTPCSVYIVDLLLHRYTMLLSSTELSHVRYFYQFNDDWFPDNESFLIEYSYFSLNYDSFIRVGINGLGSNSVPENFIADSYKNKEATVSEDGQYVVYRHIIGNNGPDNELRINPIWVDRGEGLVFFPNDENDDFSPMFNPSGDYVYWSKARSGQSNYDLVRSAIDGNQTVETVLKIEPDGKFFYPRFKPGTLDDELIVAKKLNSGDIPNFIVHYDGSISTVIYSAAMGYSISSLNWKEIPKIEDVITIDDFYSNIP